MTEAHSKSEYRRRVALGDPNVTPPMPDLITFEGYEGIPVMDAKAVYAYRDALLAHAKERHAARCMALSAEFIARGTTPLWEGYAHGAERCAEAIREG